MRSEVLVPTVALCVRSVAASPGRVVVSGESLGAGLGRRRGARRPRELGGALCVGGQLLGVRVTWGVPMGGGW